MTTSSDLVLLEGPFEVAFGLAEVAVAFAPGVTFRELLPDVVVRLTDVDFFASDDALVAFCFDEFEKIIGVLDCGLVLLLSLLF